MAGIVWKNANRERNRRRSRQRQGKNRRRTTTYNLQESVEEEIRWSRRLFQQQGWPVLDITDQAIEETAARILEMLGLTHLFEEQSAELKKSSHT